MTGYDSIQVKFNHTSFYASPLAGTRVVPFIDSYFEVLKSVVSGVQTEYFWFFASFMKLDNFDFDYIPEQHEKDQIHVWYTTHPLGGLNKEGNVFLIPTEKFKKQLNGMKFLRDFNYINHHADPMLEQIPMSKTTFKLKRIVEDYNNSQPKLYQWFVNKDLADKELPNFYPSFWEDQKLYTFGKTNDIMLVPYKQDVTQLYECDRVFAQDFEYETKPMDIVFLSYDEPGAEERFAKLKARHPRAKWVKGVKGRTKAYHTAALQSSTDYFFAVFPTIDISPDFDFEFQPDRLKNPCHYIFHCKNPVNGLEYGHRGIILYNKALCLSTIHPRLDFTLSQPHEVVPEVCGTSNFNTTPEISWRVAFREVIKLNEMRTTVESKYRLKKWCSLGQGDHAEWVQKGALDACEYFNQNKSDYEKLKLSYELEWLKQYFFKKYPTA